MTSMTSPSSHVDDAQPQLVIIHGGALGDLVLTLHVARRMLPSLRASHVLLISRVTLALEPGPLRVSHVSPEAARLHWLYCADPSACPESLSRLVRGRRVLSALGDTAAAPNVRLAQVGPSRLLCVDPAARPGSTMHIAEQWTMQLAGQGELLQACVYQRRAALDQVGNGGGDIVIHPGAGSSTKCWPLDAYVEVARGLQDRGRRVRFVIGPVEQERWPADSIKALQEAGPLTIAPDAAALQQVLGGALAYLGNDSGPSHLAAFMGLPAVALFGPTDPRTWRPLGPNVRTFHGDTASKRWAIEPRAVVEALEQVARGA